MAGLHCLRTSALKHWRNTTGLFLSQLGRSFRLKTLAKIAATALTLALAPAPALAQDEPPPLPPPAISAAMSDAEIGQGLGAWLETLHRAGVFNGAVLVARDGREIYAGALGETAAAGGTPLNADTRFPLASIGKVFTHTAIAQLIERGQLSATDTIGALLPDYPNETSRAATVEQLLNMRGGLADIFGPAFRAYAKERLTSNHEYYLFVSQQPPMFAPGAREEYCNGCYVVLGEIIERVSGMPYEQYIAQNVFAPAGMTRSGFLRYDQAPADAARFTGQPRGPEGPLEDVSRFHGVAGSAAGNVYATLRDMLAFDNALREHRLVGPAGTAAVLRGAPSAERSSIRRGFAGGGPGVSTLLQGNGAWTLVVLTNRDEPLSEAIGRAVFPLLAGNGGR